MATENIFVKAKAYHKKHPRTSWAECIQKVKGKKSVSGVKRKTVGAAKKVSGPKKRIASATHRTTPKRKAAAPKVSAKRVSVHIGKIGAVGGKAIRIAKEIERLEVQRKAIKGKILRDINARIINAKHRELNAVKSQIR